MRMNRSKFPAMKTRTKLKRWFKEANRTISKYFTVSHHKKRKNYNARKVQHADASVSTIPSDSKVIFKKRTHNKLKASTGRLFRHSGTNSRGKSPMTPSSKLYKSSKNQYEDDSKFFIDVANDLSQSSSSKHIRSKLASIKKDKDYYKKLLSTLQLAALTRAKKQYADSHRPQEIYTLNIHDKFSFKNSVDDSTKRKLPLNTKLSKISSSIREYVIKQSFSKTSLCKTESSSTFCNSAEQKTIREIKKLLQHAENILPLDVTSSTKRRSSKLLINQMSYNSLKAKISQIRKRLVNRKASGYLLEKSNIVDSTKKTDTKSVVKMNPEIEHNNEDEETELHVHASIVYPNCSVPKTLSIEQGNDRVPGEFYGTRNPVLDRTPTTKSTKTIIKTQDGLTCGQSTLVRQKKFSGESADYTGYTPERQSTSKTNTRTHQDNTKQAQEMLRCGRNKNETKDHRSYVGDRLLAISVQMVKSITKTQDNAKHTHDGQSQKKIPSEISDCTTVQMIRETQDTPKQTQDSLRSVQSPQNNISNQTKDCRSCVPDSPATSLKYVKVSKSIMKTQDTTIQTHENLKCDESLLHKQKTSSNETKNCKNYVSNNTLTSTKSIPKPQDTNQKQHLITLPFQSAQHNQNKDAHGQPPVITIKKIPQFLTPSDDYSVCKNEMEKCPYEGLRSTQTTFPLCLRTHKAASRTNQTSPRSKKKSPGCCKSSSKKSSRSLSSGTSSSPNSSSHSPISSPSGRETSTSTHRASSSDLLVKIQTNHSCDSDCADNKRCKITTQPSPSPRPSPPAPSPHPHLKRSKKRSSSVSFGEIPHSKMSKSNQNSCKAQKQMRARKSSSYCFRRRSGQSINPKSSKSKGPHYCTSGRRKSEMFEKRITNYNANKDLQRPPIVQPVLGMCSFDTCGSRVLGIKYAVVKITYFQYYTTYEMMKSTSDKPKNIPNCVEKIFVTKETKSVIT